MTGTAVAVSPEVTHFEVMQRKARAFAASSLVPEHMREQANCLAAMIMAEEMGENALVVMQNMHFIHGRPGWMTQYMVARANRSGPFSEPIDWAIENRRTPDLKVTAFAPLKSGKIVESPSISLQDAIDQGWTTFHNKKTNKTETHSRWATAAMQEQMLRWRTAAWLIRLYAPEVMFGLPTVDELQDIGHEGPDIIPPAAPAREQFEPQRPSVTDVEETEEQGDDGRQANGGAAAAAGGAEPGDADGKRPGAIDPDAEDAGDAGDAGGRQSDGGLIQSGAEDREVSEGSRSASEEGAANRSTPPAIVGYPVLKQKGRTWDWETFGREFITHVAGLQTAREVLRLRPTMSTDRTITGVKLNDRPLWDDMSKAIANRLDQLMEGKS